MAEVEFFAGHRKELEIGDYHILKSTGSERRVKVKMRIPLSNRPLGGTPEWVTAGHEVVVTDDSVYKKAVCDGVRMEGITIDFHTTDSIKKKALTLNGCTTDKFVVERVGKDDKAQTYLNFVAYAPCSKDIAMWFYDMQGATSFAVFDSTQAEFSYGGEKSSEEAEGGEEGQEELDYEAQRKEACSPEHDEEFGQGRKKKK